MRRRQARAEHCVPRVAPRLLARRGHCSLEQARPQLRHHEELLREGCQVAGAAEVVDPHEARTPDDVELSVDLPVVWQHEKRSASKRSHARTVLPLLSRTSSWSGAAIPRDTNRARGMAGGGAFQVAFSPAQAVASPYTEECIMRISRSTAPAQPPPSAMARIIR